MMNLIKIIKFLIYTSVIKKVLKKVLRLYKYCVYSTKNRTLLINKHLDGVRFLYNLVFKTKIKAWKSRYLRGLESKFIEYRYFKNNKEKLKSLYRKVKDFLYKVDRYLVEENQFTYLCKSGLGKDLNALFEDKLFSLRTLSGGPDLKVMENST